MDRHLSEYEHERLRTIATNKARLAEIMGGDALDCRTQRRTLSAEEVERRSAAGAALHKARLANRRPTSRRLVLLAASSVERASANPVASIYESSAALDALERDAPKKARVRSLPHTLGVHTPRSHSVRPLASAPRAYPGA
jgi:hypothetical protein